MKLPIALAIAATLFAAPAQADPGSPLDVIDVVYVTYLSNHGIDVPENMVGAAGVFARRLCTLAAAGATKDEIDTLVRSHYDNVGPTQTTAVEAGAAMFYCPPVKNTSQLN